MSRLCPLLERLTMKKIIFAFCLTSVSAHASLSCILSSVEQSDQVKEYTQVRNKKPAILSYDPSVDGEKKVLKFVLSPYYTNHGTTLWGYDFVPAKANEQVIVKVTFSKDDGFGIGDDLETNFGGTYGSTVGKGTRASTNGAMFLLPDGRYATAVLNCFIK